LICSPDDDGGGNAAVNGYSGVNGGSGLPEEEKHKISS
jgi:hypothetical protein